MSDSQESPCCPHCSERLRAIAIPDNAGWEQPFHWVCFNDDCPYFNNGWAWMQEKYEVKASYRYRKTFTGQVLPIGVWSKTALRDRILADDELPDAP